MPKSPNLTSLCPQKIPGEEKQNILPLLVFISGSTLLVFISGSTQLSKESLTKKSTPRHRFKSRSRVIRSLLTSKTTLLRFPNPIYLDNCQPSLPLETQPCISIMFITKLFLNFGLKLILRCLELI